MGCLKAIINDRILREHTNQLDANFKDDETFRSSKHYKMMNTLSMARISSRMEENLFRSICKQY